jgi:hypothetical protein
MRSRADNVPDTMQRCVCAPAFKIIKSIPAPTTYIGHWRLMSVRTAPHRIFLALKSPRRMRSGGNCDIIFVNSAGDIRTAGGR